MSILHVSTAGSPGSSQARYLNLTSEVQEPSSWIDERVIRVAGEASGRELIWVKGHSGVESNERASQDDDNGRPYDA